MGLQASPVPAVQAKITSVSPTSVQSWWEGQNIVHEVLAFAGGPSAASGLATTCKAFCGAVDKSWEELTRSFPQRLYVVGGLNSEFNPVDSAWRLTSGGQTWEQLPPISKPRAGPTAVLAEGQLYVLGGELSGDALADVQRFHPGSSSWETLAPMAEPRIRAAAVAAGGYIYVLGGLDGTKPLNSAERFDLRTGAWEALPPMHRPRYAGAAAVRRGCILAFGGELTEQGASASMELFDPRTGQWQLLPAVRTPTCGAAIAVVGAGRAALAVGGLGLSGQALPLSEILDLAPALDQANFQESAFEGQPPTWQTVAGMPTAKHLAVAVGFGSGVAVIGGKGPSFEASADADTFSLADGAWKVLPALPSPRLRVAVAGGRC